MRADAYFGSCFTKKASALVGYGEGGSINQSIISLFQFGFQSSITASVSEREILNEMKLEIVQLKYMLHKHQLHKLIYSYTTIFFLKVLASVLNCFIHSYESIQIRSSSCFNGQRVPVGNSSVLKSV